MVKWSHPARDDLRAIHDYIALDSRFYAQKVVREIIEKAGTIEEIPERGRVVPEMNESDVRELFVYSYRIIYQISQKDFLILAVIHGKRDISAEYIIKQ
jgi:plasmid stabilization system protein ParE